MTAEAIDLTSHDSKLVFDDGSLWFDASSGDDQLEILQTSTEHGTELELWMNGERQLQLASESVSTITIFGRGGDDTLTLNYDGSGGFFDQLVTFHGESQSTLEGDALVLLGGSFVNVEHQFINSSDGSIVLDGVTRIVYTGLEPIFDNTVVSDRVFTFGASSETITLTDASGAGMTIASTAAESVTFATPANSLTINAGGGNDTITISSIDASFNGSLTIHGDDGTDNVNLETDITFASGRNLNVDADGAVTLRNTVSLVTSGTGTVSFTASSLIFGNNSNASSDSAVTVTADNIVVGTGTTAITALSAGNGTLTLQPLTAGTLIDFGGDDAPGTLGFVSRELDKMESGTLNIGSASAGAITVSSSVTLRDSTNVSLTSGGAINFNSSFATNSGDLTLSPGAAGINVANSGVDVRVGNNNTLAFASGADLNIALNGTTVDTQYNQLNVAGKVNLTGVDLVLNGTYTPTSGQSFLIVQNDGTDAIIGTFNGLAEGAMIANFLGSGRSVTISYTGGTGNDVVLTLVGAAVETNVVLSGGNLTVTDVNGGTSNDNLTFTIHSTNLRIHDPGNTLGGSSGTTQVDAYTVDVSLADITGSVTITTLAGNDTLLFSGAPISFRSSLSIDAGAGTDTIQVNNMLTVGTAFSGAFSATAETISIAADIDSTGNQMLMGAVSLGNSISLTSDATISFSGTVSLFANSLTVVADNVDIGGNFSGTGSVTIHGDNTSDALQLGGSSVDAFNQLELSSIEIARLAEGGSLAALTFGRADSTGSATINGFDISSSSSNLTILAAQITDGSGILMMGTGDLTIIAGTGDAVLNFAVSSAGGDLTIIASENLVVRKNLLTANGVEDTDATTGESILLESRNGNITIDGSAGPIHISTDEDPEGSNAITGDQISILANSSHSKTNDVVSFLGDVTISTDGGVARQFGPRPAVGQSSTAFFTLDSNPLPIAIDTASTKWDGNNAYLDAFVLMIGVAGEQNLTVDIDWQDPENETGVTSDASIQSMAKSAGVDNVVSSDRIQQFLVPTGGQQNIVGHVYTALDFTLFQTIDRLTNIVATVSVSQHSSINVTGSRVEQFGVTQTVPGRDIASAKNLYIGPGQFEDVRAIFRIPTSTPAPVAIFASAPATVVERPSIAVAFENKLADFRAIVADIGSSAAGSSAFSTDVYFQIRRQYEVDGESEVVIERIKDNQSIATREAFEKYVRETPALQDGAGYEIWLISETGDQTVERSVVEFEITGGQPGPASEAESEKIEQPRLQDISFEQPVEVDNPPVEGAPQAMQAPPTRHEFKHLDDCGRTMMVPVPDNTFHEGIADDSGPQAQPPLATNGASSEIAAAAGTIVSAVVGRFRARLYESTESERRFTRAARFLRRYT